MTSTRKDIIAQLQKDMLSLQGFKPMADDNGVEIELGPIKSAFPNARFPLGAVHEFICNGAEDAAATGGFIAGVLGTLMQQGGAALWISASRTIFPPALKFFGINPDKIIFIDLSKEKDILWVMEEALKTEGIAAVTCEMKEISFTASRRLQLAVEQSRVTGFILCRNQRNLSTTACVTRWKVSSLPSALPGAMPGVGFPRWNIELLKVRNGKPGTWQVEWEGGRFRHVLRVAAILQEPQKKTG
ncbi:MAG: Error-prone repair protein ImuA [Ferruginibacter sp.]|nr:Error-prone repair protein ImuA [Ferruginibacter sp.]